MITILIVAALAALLLLPLPLRQLSVAVRNARADVWESTIGTTPKLQIRTGAAPANCAAAATGTLLCEITLPSDWMATASSGAKAKSGTWSGTAVATGTAGHYRIVDSAGTTCHEQGSCGQSVQLTTNGATSANSNVLNFAATTGVSVGMKVTGTGIPTTANVYVLAVGGTTVTLSHASTAGVSSSTAITFSHDLTVDNASINSGQAVSVSTFDVTEGDA